MKFFTLITLFLLALTGVATAQTGKQVLLRDVIVTQPMVLSGAVASSRHVNVTLWGVGLISNEHKVAAQLYLETLVNDAPVNCSIKKWASSISASAQCIGFGERDLALSLIEAGYAMANRAAIRGGVFEDVYKKAELSARRGRSGLWAELLPGGSDFSALKRANDTAFGLTENMAYLLIALMVLGPFVGMMIVGGVIYTGFKRLINLQKYQVAVANKKDRAMREREKFIVAASLEGEMNTNRAKLDAFVIIYEEMLKNLRDPLKDHKYKKGGEVIHKKPALLRNVYDSNVDKLDVLGGTIVTDLTALYISIEPNPEYRTIEPGTPIDDVIDFVNGIISDAEALLRPIDDVSGALNVIVRDKRAKKAVSSSF